MSANWFNSCGRVSRRNFLSDCGMGFTGLALGSMLARDGIAKEGAWVPPNGQPHFAPKAKRVIWFFMVGDGWRHIFARCQIHLLSRNTKHGRGEYFIQDWLYCA